ncbi:TPA: ead/Ea22-like family protein [Raoultella ornithinolytica]|uniref:ead/Ea22-like family protein n=1 Tax=Raoultella ornithinolytica TaxID=54291 RepID=UPI0027E653EA|nr:ead/Ea22-like family protein [Raoultella ornithinolytica]MEB7958874.1 ead/Ea22-like family protein [Raoultella ornithinolytica]HDT6090575.1 ead/Ea22-like family protein [Raoultella ornithinolytica]
MTTDITELAQSLKAAAEKASGGDWVKESGDGWDATCSNDDQANSGFIIAHFVGPDSAANREFVQLANPANIRALVEALELKEEQRVNWFQMAQKLGEDLDAAEKRIAELEREQEHLRVVGVMSEKAFHRLENRESRFIALWPRPGIYLPRKRPEDGVIVYARTAAAAGIKREAE